MTDSTQRLTPIEPDARLVARIAATGDRAALAELALRHGKTLYAVAYSVLFDPEAADEAVRATFREVGRSAHEFDARRGNVQHWIVEVVRRIATGRGAVETKTAERPQLASHLRLSDPRRGFLRREARVSFPRSGA
jgi:DNA-directed RNA polymerase specialized sigma24 family protein